MKTLKKKNIHLHHSKKTRTSKNRFSKLDYLIIIQGLTAAMLLLMPYFTSLYAQSFPGSTHRINGYTIQTIPDSEWTHSSTSVGYTYKAHSNDIFVRDGRSIDSMVETCVHEQLHNVFPDTIGDELEHKVIYGIDNEIVTDTCRRYGQKLKEKAAS